MINWQITKGKSLFKVFLVDIIFQLKLDAHKDRLITDNSAFTDQIHLLLIYPMQNLIIYIYKCKKANISFLYM